MSPTRTMASNTPSFSQRDRHFYAQILTQINIYIYIFVNFTIHLVPVILTDRSTQVHFEESETFDHDLSQTSTAGSIGDAGYDTGICKVIGGDTECPLQVCQLGEYSLSFPS